VDFMKKIIILPLFLLLILSACGSGSGNFSKGVPENGRPDFGQPERAVDINGLVKSVVGNEVTVLKIERPGMVGANSGESNEDGAKTKTGMTGMSGGKMGGGGRLKQDVDSRAAMLDKMKEMSTGEEKILIPVGIQMLKANPEDKGNPLEANLSDIKDSSMLRIWLNEDVKDRKVASFVFIGR